MTAHALPPGCLVALRTRLSGAPGRRVDRINLEKKFVGVLKTDAGSVNISC
ncbi:MULTISPECIES: hypothetical protein [unclassified Kitasatospora]|uniref:hypothetical protein n=1 Tax=unclassified Kitasatospora TaxID=2633591 RepID=UPI0033D01157